MTNNLSLYYRPTCFFCIRVLCSLPKFNLSIETKNISKDHQAMTDLVTKGGKQQVPALKITDSTSKETWMYESKDILQYLESVANV